MHKISVIIPSFNQGRFLSGLLGYLKRKRSFIHEILVLDGGSSDCTLEIIELYLEILTYYRSCKDNGQAAAVNEGILRSTGDIIVWVNSDDILSENAFELILNHFSKPNAEELLVGSSLCINERGDLIRFYPSIRSLDLRWWKYGVNLFGQASVVFKKSVWVEVGGLNENLTYALDYDYFSRIMKLKKSVKLIKSPMGVMRFYSGIKSFSTKMIPEMHEACIRNFGYVKNPSSHTHFQRFGFNVFRIYGISPVLGFLFRRIMISSSKVVPGIFAKSSLRAQCPIEAHQVRYQ